MDATISMAIFCALMIGATVLAIIITGMWVNEDSAERGKVREQDDIAQMEYLKEY